MIINGYSTAFDLGDIVYCKIDPDQVPMIITGISVRDNGIIYMASNMLMEDGFYTFELSKEKSFSI